MHSLSLRLSAHHVSHPLHSLHILNPYFLHSLKNSELFLFYFPLLFHRFGNDTPSAYCLTIITNLFFKVFFTWRDFLILKWLSRLVFENICAKTRSYLISSFHWSKNRWFSNHFFSFLLGFDVFFILCFLCFSLFLGFLFKVSNFDLLETQKMRLLSFLLIFGAFFCYFIYVRGSMFLMLFTVLGVSH